MGSSKCNKQNTLFPFFANTKKPFFPFFAEEKGFLVFAKNGKGVLCLLHLLEPIFRSLTYGNFLQCSSNSDQFQPIPTNSSSNSDQFQPIPGIGIGASLVGCSVPNGFD